MPVGRWVIRTAESVVLTLCPPGPGRAEDVDPQVVRVDGDVDLLGLGQHQDAGGRGVDAALALGGRHPLHAVHAALELQPRPDALVRSRRLDRHRDVLVAAEVGVLRVEDLGRPAAPLGVAQVHAQQVAGEQRRLLAALPRLDLEDDVLVVVGVLRAAAARAAGRSARSIGAPARSASAANDGVLGGELAGACRGRRAASSSARAVSTSGAELRRSGGPAARARAWSACTAGSASSPLQRRRARRAGASSRSGGSGLLTAVLLGRSGCRT